MLKSIPLRCTGCGSSLEITPEMDTFACGYCGASQIVQRSGGTVSLKLVTDAIRSVQVGTDKTAAELALKRLAAEQVAVGHEFHALRIRRSSKLQNNTRTFGWIWIGGFFVCVLIAMTGSVGAVFALILGIAVSVGIIYLWKNQRSLFNSEFASLEQELVERNDYIQKKIDQNRKLVD